ncbi:MAG TPA: hypothetical protein VFN13_03660 [Rudaea sp.]|nr:hypothetical protein [Rudaea sp.]
MALRSCLPVAAFVAAIVLLPCAGCSEHAADRSAPTAAIASAAAAETQPETDAGKGSGYTFRIVYPALAPEWRALDAAIRQFAAAQKKDFVGASTVPNRVAGTDYSLDLNFSVARRTADFVSVMASGSSFVGGAHGRPIVASFNLDLASGQLVDVDALFAHASIALEALSAECRRQLQGRLEARMRDAESGLTSVLRASEFAAAKQWIDKGTAPRAENFRVFLVDGLDAPAIGLTLIFPPDQVGPYADGVQQVEVPAAVFYAMLKAEYRDAFAIDTQTAQRNRP